MDRSNMPLYQSQPPLLLPRRLHGIPSPPAFYNFAALPLLTETASRHSGSPRRYSGPMKGGTRGKPRLRL